MTIEQQVSDIQFHIQNMEAILQRLATRPPCIDAEHWEVYECGKWIATFGREEDAKTFGRGPGREVVLCHARANSLIAAETTVPAGHGSRVDLAALAARTRSPRPGASGQ